LHIGDRVVRKREGLAEHVVVCHLNPSKVDVSHDHVRNGEVVEVAHEVVVDNTVPGVDAGAINEGPAPSERRVGAFECDVLDGHVVRCDQDDVAGATAAEGA
jgi:hypothetical protein